MVWNAVVMVSAEQPQSMHDGREWSVLVTWYKRACVTFCHRDLQTIIITTGAAENGTFVCCLEY